MAHVTDTNCWIDLHCGGLVGFALGGIPELFAPDIVLHELKREPSADQLVGGGLTPVGLSGAQVAEVYGLAATYKGVSAQDLSALVVAKAMGATLLTGDARLRKVAEELEVEVHGTLWILRTLVDQERLDSSAASAALRAMIASGSRFPEDHVRELLDWFAGGGDSTRPK